MEKRVKTSTNRIRMQRTEWSAYLFIAPMFIGLLLLAFAPMCYSVWASFTEFSTLLDTPQGFAGFGNFKTLFEDRLFWMSLGNTFYLMLIIPFNMIIGFLVAYALNNKDLKGRVFFRVLYYLPAVSSTIAIGIVWRWIFDANDGLLNALLGLNINWLEDPSIVKNSLMIKSVWGSLGGNMLMYLAAISGIDTGIYEAAEIDGAKTIDKIFRITLPLCKSITAYMLTTAIIGGMNSFADNYVIVSNDSSTTIVYYMYKLLRGDGGYGVMSACAMCISGIVFIFTIIQFRLNGIIKKKGE